MARVTVVASMRAAPDAAVASVRSVLAQDFADFRLILFDDASTDDTPVRLAALAGGDPRIELMVNPSCLGLTANLVRGVAMADGGYIARIDAGDLWLPGKLARQVAFLDAHPDHVLCGSQVFYRLDGSETGHVSAFGVADGEIRQRIAMRRGLFEHSSVLFRPVCSYRAALRYAQDCDLYLRLAERGRVHCLDEPLTVCRVNTGGITLGRGDLQRRYRRAAYRLARERARTGSDRLDRDPADDLGIRPSAGDSRWRRLSRTAFLRYVTRRTQGAGAARWAPWLLLAAATSPGLLGEYLDKLLAGGLVRLGLRRPAAPAVASARGQALGALLPDTGDD